MKQAINGEIRGKSGAPALAPTFGKPLSKPSGQDFEEASMLVARHDERSRIGRELHDATAQSLVSLQLQVLYLKDMFDDPQYAHRLADIEGTIRELHEEIRAVCFLSSMPSGQSGLLSSAIRRMARKFGDATGLDIGVRTIGSSVGIPVDIKISLYRIAQEALANVHRHAHANRVTLRLEMGKGEIRLAVRDDGIGVTQHELQRAAGVGISNIKRRVRELKGKFDFRSADRGSQFSVTVPIPAPCRRSSSVAA